MITFDSVSFSYGEKRLFHNLSLEFKPGCCYGLLGVNGAGKTSLLKLAAGALFPGTGSVFAYGNSPGKRLASHLADVFFVPENPSAPRMEIRSWLEQQSWLRPAFDYERFDLLCAEFGLRPNDQVHTLSFGLAKKFALAAALSSGARMLFLDEPTNGLDIPGKAQFRRMIATLSDPDRILVISTHQIRDLENLLDPVMVIHEGQLVFEADSRTLSGALSSVHLADLNGAPVVMARKETYGYSALLAEPGDKLDLELVFEAAVRYPARLNQAMRAEPMETFVPAQGGLA